MTPSPYGQRALNAEALKIRKTAVGTRHNTLRSSAYSIGQLIPEHVPEALARMVLVEAGMICAATAGGTDPMPQDEIERTIESALEAGQLNPRKVAIGFTNREAAMKSLDEIAAAWDGTPLGGWEGRRCHAVMPAILKIAREIGGPKKVPLAITRLAVNSGSSRATCAKALKDLQDLGWLSLNTPGGPARSARYDIHLPQSSTSRSWADTTHTEPHMWQRPEDAIIGHDAGRSGCVGPTGLRILKWLSDRPGFHRQT